MKFEECLEVVLHHEGGHVVHPKDPGGETNFGISKKQYPALDIANLTREQAAEIYKKDYWDHCSLEEIPPALRLMVFDCAVNQGQSFAIGTLQSVVGSKVDGIFGPETKRILDQSDPKAMLALYANRRLIRYQAQKTWNVFGKGWTARLLDVVLKS